MEELEERLKKRIPFDPDRFDGESAYGAYISSIIEDTVDIALNQLYPFRDPMPELPTKYYGWVIRACSELNETFGFAGFKSYSENGLSFTRATDGMLSTSLLSELVPYAGSPEVSEAIEDDKR